VEALVLDGADCDADVALVSELLELELGGDSLLLQAVENTMPRATKVRNLRAVIGIS
jgi:hypothetical protein